MLHAIRHDHKGRLWCGPAAISAISAISGHGTSEILRAAQAYSGRKRIMGMFMHEVWGTLRALGYEAVTRRDATGMLLWQFAQAHQADFAELPMLVSTEDHVLVLHGLSAIDNHAGSRPVAIEDSAYRCAVLSGEACTWRKVRPAVIPAVDRSHQALIARARRLAKRHGVEIQHEHATAYWVTCPALDHDDPLEGSNLAEDASEVLSKVEFYIRCLSTGYLEAVTDESLLPEWAAMAS